MYLVHRAPDILLEILFTWRCWGWPRQCWPRAWAPPPRWTPPCQLSPLSLTSLGLLVLLFYRLDGLSSKVMGCLKSGMITTLSNIQCLVIPCQAFITLKSSALSLKINKDEPPIIVVINHKWTIIETQESTLKQNWVLTVQYYIKWAWHLLKSTHNLSLPVWCLSCQCLSTNKIRTFGSSKCQAKSINI